MLASYEARYALDCLLEGGMPDAERERLGRELSDYIDHIGGEYDTLAAAHRRAETDRAQYITVASQKDDELRTLRGVVAQ